MTHYAGLPDLPGWHPGPVDGIVGNRTRDAMNLFQAQEHLDVTRVEALPL
ncbi:peptidoglycan-binding protein [Pseudomonas migulae]|jgi:peptidoglycan hydrolase-like protein with peptidoglycan-binding domain